MSPLFLVPAKKAGKVECPHCSLNSLDFLHDFGLFPSRFAGFAVPPFVVAGPRDFQHAALNLDGPECRVLQDEPVSHFFSLAKKTVAFFRFIRLKRAKA